ncbi:MAG TPA: alpha/beta hydrolase [Tepidisphaeraceae bacterium]|jgi:acetyl esterase/lipase
MAATTAPASQPLYPGQKPSPPENLPNLTFFPAQNPDGSAILVCPGGGYAHLAPDVEGEPIAAWLNSLNISAAVLRYRHAPERHPVPFQDVSRAMRMLRARSDELKLDPKRIGVCGFSAGGHLAATLSTQCSPGDANSSDPIERVSSRPDLTILGYPVITFVESCTHVGSRNNLLGDKKDPHLFHDLSAEKRVSEHTPPAFLFHTVDDPGVKVENSLLYAAALRDHGIPFEMHLYQHGPHGVGLAANVVRPGRNNPIVATWTTLCANWLKTYNFGKGAIPR